MKFLDQAKIFIKSGDGAMNYIFRSRDPDESVRQSAESAMREVVGRKKMDSVLFESKQEIAEDVKKIMQEMLDRYKTGIEVMSVAIQNAQPPQPVQAAFDDAVKAGQDRERQINEGQAYANDVIPKARGMAARLAQEAEGYKARVVETAKGDADRFAQVLKQYEKAVTVTDTYHETKSRFAWIGEIENEQLLTALETLKVEDLEIITMYAYEGYDITEISKVYGVSRPTISIKIKRIAKFLKNFNFNATN